MCIRDRYSYWDGCSGGGREGLLQAQRYPDEFDGVIAGDPATFRRNAWALWLANASFKDPADYIPPAKYPMIHQAVLDACDAIDGLKDGLIDDPTRCHFDPKILQCEGGDTPSCLTARQVQTARTILSPPTTRSGREIFPRLEPGTELRWGRLAGGPEPAALFVDYFKYIVFKDPNWDWRTFDLERDSALSDKIDKDTIALNPDLTQFAEHGGKLLIYHGWADQQVAPVASVDFYKSVVNISGDPAQAPGWVRLFMAPGMAHCAGGEGPNTFDELSSMEQWVEKGKAPDQMIASHLSLIHIWRALWVRCGRHRRRFWVVQESVVANDVQSSAQLVGRTREPVTAVADSMLFRRGVERVYHPTRGTLEEVMATAKKGTIPSDKLELYEKLDQTGTMAIRLPKDQLEPCLLYTSRCV